MTTRLPPHLVMEVGDAQRRDDLVFLANELVTNAVIHSPGDDAVSVSIEVRPATVRAPARALPARASEAVGPLDDGEEAVLEHRAGSLVEVGQDVSVVLAGDAAELLKADVRDGEVWQPALLRVDRDDVVLEVGPGLGSTPRRTW